MKIAYLSDQFLPSSSADTEQLVSMVSAFSQLSSVNITLFLPQYWYKSSKSVGELHEYYGTSGSLKLSFIKLLMPNIRGIEKIGYAIKAVFKAKKNFDALYTRNLPVVLAALLFTDKPIFYETYRPWPNQNLLGKIFFSHIQKYNQLAGIILHSKFAGKSYRSVGFEGNRLLVSHNAVNLGDLEENYSKQELRLKLDLSDSDLIVTYTGRVSVNKGLMRMLELAKHFPKVLFLIVGSENEGEIEQRAKNIPNIRIVGWQSKQNVFRYLKASDVLYIPTSREARDQVGNTVLPLKTFIYMASGTAIIAPDMEDLREVLTHEETALLVTPDDTEEEIQGLRYLIENEALRASIGDQAYEVIKNNSWTARAEQVLDFMKNRIESLQ